MITIKEVLRWKKSCATFAREALNIDLTPAQEQAIGGLALAPQTTAHFERSKGATTALVVAALWEAFRGLSDSRTCLVVAPTTAQLREVFVPKLHRTIDGARADVSKLYKRTMAGAEIRHTSQHGQTTICCMPHHLAQHSKGIMSPVTLLIDQYTDVPQDSTQHLRHLPGYRELRVQSS